MFAKGKKPNGGLSSALGEYRLPFEGKAHRADVDAFNTLRLFFHILKSQFSMECVINQAKRI
jgi:inhibitor of KinA sporulation pathway (predicted exonuclease)